MNVVIKGWPMDNISKFGATRGEFYTSASGESSTGYGEIKTTHFKYLEVRPNILSNNQNSAEL